MIALGIDFGTKRIGLAISDPLGIMASALTTIERKTAEDDIKKICEIVKTRNVDKIIMGLPLHMNGQEGREAAIVKAFKTELEKAVDLPVELMDERWTTVMAQKSMLEGDLSRKKRKQKIDRVAAQFILQTYLERLRFRT